MPNGRNKKNDTRRRPQRPRVGAVYEWHPSGLDKDKSKLNIEPGSLVRVAKGGQFGSLRLPPPFTYVEDPISGNFLGLTLDESLKPRNTKNR
jgi:hypothetical protein